ncbi:MAG: PLP-dependent aminotransferase family protein [Vagococcus sp.]|uniref:aminotransferase-like domain-containing protein n=1 Tax=Vagococcus TaxID=2737 RepID=UPI002FCC1157
MLYKKIAEHIKHDISNQTLQSGDKLPSIRTLSTDFDCSKNTIIKALSELEQEHLIYALPKQGYFVAIAQEQTTERPLVFDFLSAEPNPDSFNIKNLLSCSEQIIGNLEYSLLPYGPQLGLEKLRTELVNYLQSNQVFTKKENIVITTGSQQAIDILFNMPFPNKKEKILLEQPTYSGALTSANLSKEKVIGISMNKGELDLNQLEYIFKNNDIKLFYTIPRFHNPMGTSYSTQTKKKIVELAHKYDVFILEDDYLGELDLDSKADPLFAYDTSDKIIYLKSFSKIFLPGLRIGAVCLPNSLRQTFLSYKFARDIATPIFSQEILATFITNGMFYNHVKQLKEYYAKKMTYTLICCHDLLPKEIKFTTPKSGFYFVIELPDYISATDLKTTLKLKNVLVEDVSNMYLSHESPKEMIRLCIAKIDEKDIYDGTTIIATEINALTNQKKSVFKNWEFYI